MSLSNVLGASAGVTILIAYVFYLRQAMKGLSTPNPASWAIWLVAGTINSFTYFTVVEGNIWQSLYTIAVTFSVVVILIYSSLRGRFSPVTSLEVVTFLLALAIGVYWQMTSNDRIANLVLQAIFVLSYIPTIVGLLRGRAKESIASWLTAVIAYIMATLALLTNYPSDWIAFVSPVLNGIIGNGLVVLLIIAKKRK